MKWLYGGGVRVAPGEASEDHQSNAGRRVQLWLDHFAIRGIVLERHPKTSTLEIEDMLKRKCLI
ncbi:MAG: hypothetical protein ABSF96_13730 [Steroidobacteraceae bacterium]